MTDLHSTAGEMQPQELHRLAMAGPLHTAYGLRLWWGVDNMKLMATDSQANTIVGDQEHSGGLFT